MDCDCYGVAVSDDPLLYHKALSLLKVPLTGVSDIRSRSVSGVKVLTIRTFVSVLLRAASSLTLAHLLFQGDYGLFGVASYITGMGQLLSDIGLGGAMLRQNEQPSEDETFTVFWSQQLITCGIIALLLLSTHSLVVFCRLAPNAGPLIEIMSLGLIFSSLRVVPVVTMERDLRFAELARCEMIENVAQTASTIAFAYFGAGAWSFAWGGLIRGAVGLVCVWMVSPWRPRGRFRWSIVTRLAKFGIPFQLNSFVPSILGAWLPLTVSRLLGVAAMGFVGWAINIASIPQMLSLVLYRVAFPALSRLQNDTAMLMESLRTSVRRISAGLSLLLPLALLLAPVFIPIIFGKRWIPAVPLVQWFCFEALALTLNNLLSAAQNAAGFASDRLWVATIACLLRWGLGYAGLVHFGMNAIGPVQAGVACFELYLSVVALRFRFPASSIKPLEVFTPLLKTSGILIVSIGAGDLLARSTLATAAISLAVFIGLTAWQGLTEKDRPMLTEINALVRMARRAHPAAGA